ncbi:MAG: DNA-3-methyladenine glycosylase [Candidatus Bathyarchaeia archaeon]
MGVTKTLILPTIAPFNFDLSAAIFANGDKQVRKYDGEKFWQVTSVNGKFIHITVKADNTARAPKLTAELRSNDPLSLADEQEAKQVITRIFNLNLDLKTFYRETASDNILLKITQKLEGLRSTTTPTVFEALVDAIIEQQISTKVANGIKNRLIKSFGVPLSVDGDIYFTYPTPQNLARADITAICQCGLSQKKAEYIKNAALLVVSGKLDLEKLCLASTEEILHELDRLRGVGVWTAEYTMLRGMQKFDAFPADDLGLRRVISRYYNFEQLITSRQARLIAEKWGKWKGLAAYYLMIADGIGL